VALSVGMQLLRNVSQTRVSENTDHALAVFCYQAMLHSCMSRSIWVVNSTAMQPGNTTQCGMVHAL